MLILDGALKPLPQYRPTGCALECCADPGGMVMKWFLLPAAAMLSLASFAIAAPQDWKGDTSYASPGHSLKSARESLASGYYAGAVADLATLIRRVLPDAEVYFLLGAAHWGNGNPEEAHKALETALAMDPRLESRLGEYPAGPGTAGRISLRRQSLAKPVQSPARVAASGAAEEWMKNTSFLTPGHAYKSGLDEAAAGNFSAAANWFREVVASKPGSAEAWFQLGAAARAAGQTREAQAALDTALRIDPSIAARIAALSAEPRAQAQAGAEPPIGSAEYFLKYARLHLENGDGPAAAKYAREALKAEPGHSGAQALLSRALRAGPAKPKTCQQQWSSCWVTAREFSDKNMCTQRRLACEANAR